MFINDVIYILKSSVTKNIKVISIRTSIKENKNTKIVLKTMVT